MGEGFQPSADDVVETIRDDDADVEIVSAREHIDLLDADDDHGERDHHEEHTDDDHDEETEHDGHEGDEAEGDHDHDSGVHDSHFWLDLQRTEQAVVNIRDDMISVDPENEQDFRERAETYVGKLDELHTEFDAVLSDAEKAAVFVAGHNAFRYLGNAYDFDVFGLTGISPDEGISASARREAEAIIDEDDIEYVLHPVLESRTPAEQLVADTGAKDVLDVTAISGVTDERVDADKGLRRTDADGQPPLVRESAPRRMTVIRLDDVSIGYTDAPVLESVSLSIEAGEFLGLVGPNGSGKPRC